MTILLSILLLVLGFAILIKGADWLVDGASSIASSLGVSDLMIGLTVVAFGTSAPELFVNVVASIQGHADIVMGDIVGSNIANTFLVLGIAAVIAPLAVQSSTVWKEIPLNLLAGIVLFVMAGDLLMDGSGSIISRSEGVVLICLFAVFLYYTFGLRHGNGLKKSKSKMRLPMAITLVLVGCVMLPVGAHMVVRAAETIATIFGVSEALIGLTIVALGTSLPEAAAAGVAAWRGKSDIAVGNVVGSNIFNICWVLGISAIIRPVAFEADMTVDLLIVVFSSLFLFGLVHRGPLYRRFLFFWKQKIPEYNLVKHEGIVLMILYVMYIVYIGVRG